jgi:hypothetical protein
MFLLYRIGEAKDRNIIESIVKTELAGHMKIFDGIQDKQHQHSDPLQFMLISKLLAEKLHQTRHLPLYLKAMMVENDIVSQLLSRYFTTTAGRLPLSVGQQKTINALNNTLGSYLHF